MELYYRKCDHCGCGMNEGYVWGDGEGYACSDKCLFVDGYTPAQRDIDFENDIIYWTEWEDEDSAWDVMFTKDGKEIEMETK